MVNISAVTDRSVILFLQTRVSLDTVLLDKASVLYL